MSSKSKNVGKGKAKGKGNGAATKPVAANGAATAPAEQPAENSSASEDFAGPPADSACNPDPKPVNFGTSGDDAPSKPVNPGRSMTNMTLKLVRSKAERKNPRLVIYNIEGRTGSVQFLSTLFGGSQTDQGNPPEELELAGTFAEPKPKVERAKETPEERKARLAAMPKLTLAEKVAKAEARTAALRAKLAAAQAGQPSA